LTDLMSALLIAATEECATPYSAIIEKIQVIVLFIFRFMANSFW